MIQLIAMITMFLDHLGIMLDCLPLRIIGRLSMPLYAYMVIQGISKTKDFQRMQKRYLLIAAAAQLPFMVITYERYGLYFNVCFTWYLCTNILYYTDNHSKLQFVKLLLSFFALLVVPTDYGLIALCWCFLWYLHKEKNLCGCIGLALPIIVISLSLNDYIQLLSFAAVPLVLLLEKYGKIYIDKKYRIVWRLFYPLHLGVLACLR